jgi:ATP-binding protein involved in chromosome partitioning
MSTPLTVQQLKDLIGRIVDPQLGVALSKIKMVGDIQLSASMIPQINIVLPTPAYTDTAPLGQLIQDEVTKKAGIHTPCDIRYSVKIMGKETGGSIGLRVKNVIAVGSGKGGVGKSTVATSLALGLKHLGAKVGLLDADVYGPSIPHMLGSNGKPAVAQFKNTNGQLIERIQPVDHEGMPLMSIGFMVEPDQAVIWRGPMLHKLLTQFLKDTDWGELDYLIIDLPPGTGDVSLTISQMLGLAGAVVVCSPQQVALLDAVKAVAMYQKLEIPVLGMVENMSGEIFGRGGAAQKAKDLKIPFLGEIPMDATIRIKGDASAMADLYTTASPTRDALIKVVQNVAFQIVKNLAERPALPTLEILQ